MIAAATGARLSSSSAVAGVAAAALALATLYAGLHWGSTVAGGADSYGYVSEAGLVRQGRLAAEAEIARASPWPLAINTWAPLGYVPALGRRDAVVPLYPPGLPIVMALAQAIGGFCAAFVVTPVCGALAVWLTFAMARRVCDSAAVAVAAAILVASSPIFLYQLMNPMTDVPVTAFWAAAAVLTLTGRPFPAGFAAGVAILIRPNLAPVALVPAVWLAVSGAGTVRAAWFLAGLIPAALVVAAINTTLYGAPWIAGYGSVDALYALSYAAPNLRQFGRWLLDTQTPIVAAAIIPLVVGRSRTGLQARDAVLLGALIATIVACYTFYIPFDAWWYLRFLLPMWPMLMVLVAAAPRAILGPGLAADVVLALLVAVVAVRGVRMAADRSTFELARGERRYLDVARYFREHTDPGAVAISVQHSGTLRLYGGRLTLRFDQLDPLWLDRAAAFLQASGRHPYIVVEGAEVDVFRERFGAANAIGRLDWRPVAAFASPYVAVYDAVDRGSAVEPLAIAATATRRAGWRCDPPYEWPTPLRMK